MILYRQTTVFCNKNGKYCRAENDVVFGKSWRRQKIQDNPKTFQDFGNFLVFQNFQNVQFLCNFLKVIFYSRRSVQNMYVYTVDVILNRQTTVFYNKNGTYCRAENDVVCEKSWRRQKIQDNPKTFQDFGNFLVFQTFQNVQFLCNFLKVTVQRAEKVKNMILRTIVVTCTVKRHVLLNENDTYCRAENDVVC
jgi:hypothetical protein